MTVREPGPDNIRETALRLLARREHSCRELAGKLAGRGYDPALVDALSADLVSENLLSDARFTESYVHSRQMRGCGPVRIRAELRKRGIDDGLISENLKAQETPWEVLIDQVRTRRFGAPLPLDVRERARQTRFLLQRGFTTEQIREVLKGDH